VPEEIDELRLPARHTEPNEKGLPVVEAVWDVAYRGLTPRAARLYLLLAGHPAAHFPPQAAAAALGEGQDAAEEAVDKLETAGLLEVRLDGHLHLREPLRAHARRRAREDGEANPDGGADAGEARAATLRVIRWYRRQAERADLLAAGPRLRFAAPLPAPPYAPDVPLADGAEARRWLEAERRALFGCVRLAREHGPDADADAWALCEPLWTHFLDHLDRRPYADAIDAFRTGVAAAGRAGQPAAQARMRCQLARPLWELGRFDEAREQLDRAVATAEALGPVSGSPPGPRRSPSLAAGRCSHAYEGDPPPERSEWGHLPGPHGPGGARHRGGISQASEGLGEPRADPAGNPRQALGETADPRLLPSAVEFRGRLLAARGDWSGAAAAFERSLAMHRAIGNDYGVLLTTHLLGRAAARLGKLPRAAGLLAEAHAMARAQRRERLIGRTAHERGLALRALGETRQAAELLHEALRNARRRGSAHDEAQIRQALADG
jgi:tetratricopeptide (TPR) repeat protein